MSAKQATFTVEFGGETPDDDYDVPCARNELGGGYDTQPRTDSDDSRAFNLILATAGVQQGSSSARATGAGKVATELTVSFGESDINTCCQRYVADLCWMPHPLIYPDIRPPALAYEIKPPEQGQDDQELDNEPLPLDEEGGVPIIYYIEEDEGVLSFDLEENKDVRDYGMKISIPTGPANSWVPNYGYQITWTPPLSDRCAPQSLRVRGPMPSGEIRNPDPFGGEGTLKFHAATLPITFELEVGDESYPLKRMEMEPSLSSSCGFLHFHKPITGSVISDCEWYSALMDYAEAFSAWSDAFAQWQRAPADDRGPAPAQPELPQSQYDDQPRESRFDDALDLQPDLTAEDEGEEDQGASLFDLLDAHRDEDSQLPDATIVARIDRTYGRWDFELHGDCGEDSAQARQGSYFYRDKPGDFNPSYSGNVTKTEAVKLVHVNPWTIERNLFDATYEFTSGRTLNFSLPGSGDDAVYGDWFMAANVFYSKQKSVIDVFMEFTNLSARHSYGAYLQKIDDQDETVGDVFTLHYKVDGRDETPVSGFITEPDTRYKLLFSVSSRRDDMDGVYGFKLTPLDEEEEGEET